MKLQQNAKEPPETEASDHIYADPEPKVSNKFDISTVNGDRTATDVDPPFADSFESVQIFGRIKDIMSNATSPSQRSPIHSEDAEVHRLATSAMNVLASRADASDVETPFAELFALADAYIAPDDSTRHDIVARILGRGVSPEDIVDEVIPATARYIGKLWGDDRLSFADVTIGTARLQQTVRAMSNRHLDHDPSEGPRILLIVPRTENHTLGIFVLSEQFRRLGCSVHIAVGSSEREIVSLVRRTPFDMIGISAGSRRSLSAVRDIVKGLRTDVPRKNRIVLGGAVTDLDVDLKLSTGVDYICTSVEDALFKCNIEMTRKRVTLS